MTGCGEVIGPAAASPVMTSSGGAARLGDRTMVAMRDRMRGEHCSHVRSSSSGKRGANVFLVLRLIDEKPLWMLTGLNRTLRLCESGHSSVASGQNLTHMREVS
jgi:hypothetical protein